MRLSWIRISLCLIASPQGGKMRHHWGSRRNKCQATTLYKSCINLSYGKQNAICRTSHRVVGMQLYNRRRQRFKWKDLKTFNIETHVQNNADRVGEREGIKLGWSQRFRLDELDIWQECWWQSNLWLVNWRPHVGHKTLGGNWGRVEEIGVGWGVWSWPIVGTNKVGGEKCLNYAWSKGFGKV
jgi:hypothetical protein